MAQYEIIWCNNVDNIDRYSGRGSQIGEFIFKSYKLTKLLAGYDLLELGMLNLITGFENFVFYTSLKSFRANVSKINNLFR